MTRTEIVLIDGRQAVKLPDGFRFGDSVVSIRKQGNAVILEPVRSETWPPGFFDAIRIDDPAFERPPQGDMPPAPAMNSQ